MASMLVMSEASSALSSTAPSSCSSSRPIGTRHRPGSNNFDFSAYLLSTSPPGFELSPGVFSCGLPPSQRLCYTNSYQVPSPSSVLPEWNLSRTSSSSRLDTSDGELSPPHSVRSSLSGSRSGGGLTKKVSFADDLGMLLEQICFFYESSDTPPNLSPKIMRRYSSVDNLSATPNSALALRRMKRMSASMPTLHSVVNVPRLIPNFAMPVANRSAYLERIDRACVSLESVRVLPVENGSGTPNGSPPVIDRLVGSVAVRNLAYEKRVTARCTFDSWASYINVRAVYARSERVVHRPAPDQPLSSLEFDVFEFSINLPARWRASRGERPRMELAVRFDVDGKTFWDNNDGQNYELVGTSNNTTTRSILRDDQYISPCWTEFSGWNNVDPSYPYW